MKKMFMFLMALVMLVAMSTVAFAADGSEADPYISYDAEFTTESIAAGTSVYYNLYGVGNMLLTINSADAYVVYEGTPYEAVDGVVTVQLGMAFRGAPISLQIGNAGDEATTFDVVCSVPVGTFENPEVLDDISEITTNLPAASFDGYYYSWTADMDGMIEIKVTSNTAGEPEVILMNNSSYATKYLSSDATDPDGDGVATLMMGVTEGDEIIINVLVFDEEDPWADSPASTLVLEGTKVFTANETEFTTVEIEPNYVANYNLYGVGNMVLTINSADAYVVYEGTPYEAVDGVVTVQLGTAFRGAPISLQIGNAGDEVTTFDVVCSVPVGTFENPEVLDDISEITTNLPAASFDGYYYSWTADMDGMIEIKVASNTAGEPEVILMNNSSYATKYFSSDATDPDGDGVATLMMGVTEGDEIIINVLVFDEEDPWADSPASTLVLEGTKVFTANETEFTTVEIEPNYVANYNLYGVGNMVLTINSADAYVVYEGTPYEAVDGVVTVQLGTAFRGAPIEIQIGNSGDSTTTFDVTCEIPLGAYENPEVVADISEITTDLAAEDEDGYHYSWTATEDASLEFKVNSNTAGTPDVIVYNLTTGQMLTLSADGTDEDGDGVYTMAMDVAAGDEFIIQVLVFDENWGPAPASTLVLGVTDLDDGAQTGDFMNFVILACVAGIALVAMVASKKVTE